MVIGGERMKYENGLKNGKIIKNIPKFFLLTQ